MQPQFVHLRLHSEFSLVDGIVRISPLVKRLAALQMPAVAITEQSNLFSLVKFYKAANSAGIKAIVGADVLLLNPEDPANPSRLTLLVRNKQGYTRLTELISRAYQQGQHQGIPMLQNAWLVANNAGLICLSGAMEGDIGKALLAENFEMAKQLAQRWATVFPENFYLEIQRVGKTDEERYLNAVLDLALELDLPLVATNDVRFLDAKEFAAHEVRVCINQGRVLDDARRPKNYTEQQYLRSTAEMLALFADIPEAIENTVEIAKRCNLTLKLGENYLPDFPVPAGTTLDAYFQEASRQGLAQRLQEHPPIGKGTFAENQQLYAQRLETELSVICQMGFPGYFMIVADFIQWAKQQQIPVGPGRGSGAGSLVAYSLRITDLDPLEFELLFERFLNPERVSMPDFDIDFCMDRRDEVIDYVAQRYGRERVSQIITYGSMAAKAVIRDVGRVLNLGYGFVDRLAKLIPFEIGMTLEKALDDSSELKKLYETDEEVKTLINMALSLEGICRNAGKHAGGVVISPTKLTDFTPLYCEQDGSNLVTQFDKNDVEAVGLVKFDFLGLRTLTIIDWALQDINVRNKRLKLPIVDISQIPRNDAETYTLLKAGLTTAVFQLESRGMKELIKKLKPDCFDDIIALVALFRPGPLESGMVDDYVEVKHKRRKAEYAHPVLEPILKPTNGVILYQEQVMQIARDMAQYTMGGADMLRRAMGKKDVKEMAQQRDKFTSGALAQKINDSIATYVFDLMEKFAGYGFNKSHSAAYALVAYQTAWLKVHYPAAFMAAVLSSDMDNTDKVVNFIEECRQMKLNILPPHLNLSYYKFTVTDDDRIVYGLGAVKGVGEAAIVDMVMERQQHGQFLGLYDLCKRVDLRKFNRRVLEALIRAGAFDEFNPNRASHLVELPTALKVAEQHGKSVATGQNDFFGLSETTTTEEEKDYSQNIAPWTNTERLNAEEQVLGFYLSGHPIDSYLTELTQLSVSKISDVLEKSEKSSGKLPVRVAGFIVDMKIQADKNRCFVAIKDNSGQIEIAIFNELYDSVRPLIIKDHLIVVDGEIEKNTYSGGFRLTAKRVYNIEQARSQFAQYLIFEWRVAQKNIAPTVFINTLREILQPFKGGQCPLRVRYFASNATVLFSLGEEWKVKITDELLLRLQRCPQITGVEIKYKQN